MMSVISGYVFVVKSLAQYFSPIYFVHFNLVIIRVLAEVFRGLNFIYIYA